MGVISFTAESLNDKNNVVNHANNFEKLHKMDYSIQNIGPKFTQELSK